MAEQQELVAADMGCFASVNELRLEHLKLMERDETRDDHVSEAVVADIRAFVARTQVTGSVLSDRNERREAQGILDYWSSTLVSLGGADLRTWSQPRLADYQADAKRGEKPVDAERTKAELTRLDENARQLIRMSALARQWKTGGRYEGYLLIKDALEDAKKFKGQDDDIDALIKASDELVVVRNRNWRLGALTLIAVLSTMVICLAALVYNLNKTTVDLQARTDDLEKKTDELNDALKESRLRLLKLTLRTENLNSRNTALQSQIELSTQITKVLGQPPNIEFSGLPDVRSFDTGSDEERLRAVVGFNRRLLGKSSTPADQLALGKAFVAMTDPKQITLLSSQGQHYLFFVLSLIPAPNWAAPEWQETRNQLRQNLTDLQSALDVKQIILEPKSEQYLDAVRSYIGLPEQTKGAMP